MGAAIIHQACIDGHRGRSHVGQRVEDAGQHEILVQSHDLPEPQNDEHALAKHWQSKVFARQGVWTKHIVPRVEHQSVLDTFDLAIQNEVDGSHAMLIFLQEAWHIFKHHQLRRSRSGCEQPADVEKYFGLRRCERVVIGLPPFFVEGGIRLAWKPCAVSHFELLKFQVATSKHPNLLSFIRKIEIATS